MRKPFLRLVAALTATAFTTVTLAQTVPVTNYGYDVGGKMTSMSEPNGQAHGYQYNAFGELSVHQPPNPNGSGTTGQVVYGRNGQGAITSVTDTRGLTTGYGITGTGDTMSLASPDTNNTSSQFDEAGNRTSYTDGRGVTVSTTYDKLNRPTQVNYGDAVVTLGYDAGYGAGKLTSVVDTSGSTAWTFDKLGNVTSKSQVTGSTTLNVGYTYFSGGRVASITYPSGAVVGFTYDGANVASITVNGSTAISGVSYFPFGAPKAWTMGSIGTFSRQADTYGRLTGDTAELGSRTLSWDASSRLTGITEPGQASRSYGYDGLNRLTTANETATKAYGYDLNGNRTSETVNGTAYAYGVDGGSNRLTASANSVQTRSYSYDAVGNTTSDGTRGFTYNGAGQLATVTASSSLLGQYAYNGIGQRVKKTNADGDRFFVYAEDGVSLLGEYTTAGAVSETVYLNGVPVMVLKGGTAYFVLSDHLNTPRVIKNSVGAVVWRWKSDAFGNGAAEDNPGGVSQFVFNQRFSGQQFDTETGLHYNNARYYDPVVGRYITSDSIGLEAGLNTYAYVNNGPGNVSDPSGNIVPLVLGVLRVGFAAYTAYETYKYADKYYLSDDAAKNRAEGDFKVDSAMALAAVTPLAIVQKVAAPVHHICTNKNLISMLSGGPWTPRFDKIFKKAGYSLGDDINLIAIPGHKGPHPQAYHEAIFDRLIGATQGLSGPAFKAAFEAEMGAIRSELTTVGTQLNKWITKT
jgi:RHS repeat-associated protein